MESSPVVVSKILYHNLSVKFRNTSSTVSQIHVVQFFSFLPPKSHCFHSLRYCLLTEIGYFLVSRVLAINYFLRWSLLCDLSGYFRKIIKCTYVVQCWLCRINLKAKKIKNFWTSEVNKYLKENEGACFFSKRPFEKRESGLLFARCPPSSLRTNHNERIWNNLFRRHSDWWRTFLK